MNLPEDVDSRESDRSAAFGEFYRGEVAGQVRRATLILGSDDAANDVVHDSMVEVFRRWDGLVSPGAYLNRSVLNKCHDVGRRSSAVRRLLPRLIDRAPRPSSDEMLGDVVDSLPFNQRAVIVLRFYDGLSTAEIAAVLGCAPGSVGPWIDRALKKMRKALQ